MPLGRDKQKQAKENPHLLQVPFILPRADGADPTQEENGDGKRDPSTYNDFADLLPATSEFDPVQQALRNSGWPIDPMAPVPFVFWKRAAGQHC